MKKMLKPEIEFVRFCTEDVITTSAASVKYSLPDNKFVEGEDVQFGNAFWDINEGFPLQ